MHTDYTKLLNLFAPRRAVSTKIWSHVQVLVTGALLLHGQRTVTAVLRVMGLHSEKHFVTFHRVLSRAVWACLALSRILLGMLIRTFVPNGPLVMGLDDTIERRRGEHIRAKGIYRDPVRSSHSHVVKASGLRWLSVMLLAPIPWAKRVWALPFLTALCPSQRFSAGRGRAHKTLTDWARQMMLQVRRWVPDRQLIFVVDSSFAVIALLAHVSRLAHPICMIARFRLDAALYEPVPPRLPGTQGRPRVKGSRLPTLNQHVADPRTRWQLVTLPHWYGEAQREVEIVSGTAVWYHKGVPAVPIRWVLIRDPLGKFKTQALLCTDLTITPEQIVQWFVWRWNIEVTFREVREHLGVETQRQWSDKAIARTTPVLLGLFSLVTLLANCHAHHGKIPVRSTAWYAKPLPTFSDALAVVRYQLWLMGGFGMSHAGVPVLKLRPAVLERLSSALCYPI